MKIQYSFLVAIVVTSILTTGKEVFSFSCENKWVTYRTDVEVRTDTNEIMPGAFVRCYPELTFKTDQAFDSRAGNDGIAMVVFQSCSEYGPLPEVVKARCNVTDRWEGNYYKISHVKVKFLKTRSRTSVYSAMLNKKE